MKKEDWQNAYDYYEACKEEMNKIKREFHEATMAHISSIKDLSVAEAYERNLIKLNFSTEGLPKHLIEEALNRPI